MKMNKTEYLYLIALLELNRENLLNKKILLKSEKLEITKINKILRKLNYIYINERRLK